MFPDGRSVIRQAAGYWWVPLVSGVVWLLIAWVVLRLNETSVATVGALIGVVFILAGLSQAALGALMMGGWKVWHYVMAFIFLLGGLWGFIEPIDTFFALASVLGLILIFYGVFEIVQAVALREVSAYWWIGLVTGALLILLAFLVSSSDRAYALQERAYLILFWVGLFALFRGFNLIMLAFGIRHSAKELDKAM